MIDVHHEFRKALAELKEMRAQREDLIPSQRLVFAELSKFNDSLAEIFLHWTGDPVNVPKDGSSESAAPAVGVSFDVVMSAVPHADASDGVSFASKKEVTIRMLLILLECV